MELSATSSFAALEHVASWHGVPEPSYSPVVFPSRRACFRHLRSKQQEQKQKAAWRKAQDSSTVQCHPRTRLPTLQVLFDKLNETQQQRPKTRVRPSLLFLALWPVCTTLQPSGTSRACQSKACRAAKVSILQRTQRTGVL